MTPLPVISDEHARAIEKALLASTRLADGRDGSLIHTTDCPQAVKP